MIAVGCSSDLDGNTGGELENDLAGWGGGGGVGVDEKDPVDSEDGEDEADGAGRPSPGVWSTSPPCISLSCQIHRGL